MYKEKRISNVIGFLFAALLLLAFVPSKSEAAMSVPAEREMKLLIKPEAFADRNNGYQTYWEMIKALASDRGVAIKERKNPLKEEVRRVTYYDTKNLDLSRNNYLLRQRIKIKNEVPEEKCDLTLKCRTVGGQTVSDDAVISAEGFKPSISLQEDYAGFVNGIVGNNKGELSLSHTIKDLPLPERNTLDDYAAFFPTLKNLDISLTESCYPIKGIAIIEYQTSPGSLDFGGKKESVNISLWCDEATGTPIVAEISWECSKEPTDMAIRAQDFFNALQEKTKDSLYPGQMKSSFVFGDNK